MINLMSTEELAKYPVVALPETPAKCGGGSCARYRPGPQVSGNLSVDPEIHLPSVGMDVDIAYYYNGSATNNGPFGYGVNLSPNLTAQASGSPMIVTLTRGNGALVSYQYSSGTYVAQTPGVLNSLVQDTTHSYWKETTLDGVTTAYPLDTGGNITSVSYVQDPVGNTHSYSYSSGVLNTIEDAVGRRVSFSYSSGLLSGIQDWANRLTTFQYNSASASPLSLLTTVTGPTGCQTQYQYSTFTQFDGSTMTGKWMMSGIVDPNGYQTTYSYDMQGRVVRRGIAGAGITTYLYMPGYMWTVDALGNNSTQAFGSNYSLGGETNAVNSLTTYTRNANLQELTRQTPLGAVRSTTYTGAGLVASSQTPLGAITSLSYDAYNNPQTMQTPDGAVWTTLWGYSGSSFDTTGAKRRPQVTIDPLGNRVTMGYTGQGLLQYTQDMSGAMVTLGYNNFGDQISTQDALGFFWTVSRDLAGNPVAQMNPLGAIWSQSFDNENRPLVSTDPLNNVTQNGYDSVGNRVVQIQPLGNRTSWIFNVFDLPVSQQDALGIFSTTVFDSLGRVTATIDSLANRSSIMYDFASRPIAQMNPLNAVWTTILDANGRPIGAQNPLGFISSTVWDSADRVVESIDQLGNINTAIYDANSRQIASLNPLGFLSSTIFDLASRPVAQVDALGNRSSTVYDGRNLAIAQIDPLSRISSTIYNANQAVIASQDPAGFLATAILDGASRNIASLDANSNLSSTVFDIANRPIAWVNALNFRGSTTYDASSNPIQMTDPLNRISTNVMDPLNRIQATISPLGYITTINRDADGRTMSVQNASGFLNSTIFDNASRAVASVSPLGYVQTTLYDIANRVVGNQNALGFIYSAVLDAANRPIATVNPLGFRSSAVFDAASQRIASIDALGNYATNVFSGNGSLISIQNQLGYITSFILDAASQRICVVDANIGRSTTIFSNRGFVSATQDQLGALTSFTQDPNGNTILRVDARNWPATYTMDALNRTAKTLYVDSTRVTNTWDAASQQITSQDVTGITSMVWDLDSRYIATQNPAGINLTSTLDPLGNRLVMADPYGLTTNTWDMQSRLINVASPNIDSPNISGSLITSIAWDPLDRELIRYSAVIETTVSHIYDSAGREIALNTNGFFAPSFTNYYNAIDNRVGVVESSGGNVSYVYDLASQLINEQRTGPGATNTTYSYDPLGNRLLQNANGLVTTRTFNGANAQLTSVPHSGAPTTSTFDANGNLTGEVTGVALTTLMWDPENRMLAYGGAAGSENYQYSQDGLRKKKVNSSGTTLFTWDGQNCALESDASLNFRARRTDYPGYWGGLSYQLIDGYTNIPLFDGQRSTRFAYWITSNMLIWNGYVFDAFGNLLSTPPSQPNPMQYVGQEGYYTDATGFIYDRARIYDPVSGRFISRDPIGMAGAINEYGYVGNNPVNWSDPLGLQEAPITPSVRDPKTNELKCAGICGPAVDSWLHNEIGWQLQNAKAYKALVQAGDWDLDSYLLWTYLNQGYKFGKGLYDFTWPKCGTLQCANTVMVCGTCMKTHMMGNIMFGLALGSLGMSVTNMANHIEKIRTLVGGLPVYKRYEYGLGSDLYFSLVAAGCIKGGLVSAACGPGVFCNIFKSWINGSNQRNWTQAFTEFDPDSGGTNTFANCRPCGAEIGGMRHGGNPNMGWRPDPWHPSAMPPSDLFLPWTGNTWRIR